MPELPEVETIRRSLAPVLVGTRIARFELLDTRLCAEEPAVIAALTGRTVTAVRRRGKHLILDLDDGHGIVIHLRMTGALLLQEAPRSARIRAVITFSTGTRLLFNDMRRLGTLRVVDDTSKVAEQLGPEPLAEEFTPAVLADRLARHRIPVKAALLDQHIVAGVGNMYADEALFEACIHPLVPANELDEWQIEHLWRAIRAVLERAIERQGASVDTYWLPNGERGSAHGAFCVAHRRGMPCPRCGTSVERVMVRKRGAYYCPVCQRGGPGETIALSES